MSVIFIALGMSWPSVLAVIVPWALVRMLERDDRGKEDG